MAVLRTSNAYCRTYSCAASQIAIKKKSHEFSVYPGGTLADGLNTLYTSIEPDDGIIAFKSCPLPVRRVLFSLLDSRFDYGELNGVKKNRPERGGRLVQRMIT